MYREAVDTRESSGPMATGGGLVFLGGGAPYLYEFDKAMGTEVWRGATRHLFEPVRTR